MVRMFKTGYRSTSVPIGAYEPFEFSHVKRADVALDDLNHLTQASRRHDRDFIDDLNAKLIVDSSLGLPPRSVRKHHYQQHLDQGFPSGHLSRRVVTEYGGNYGSLDAPLATSYLSRGYSLPPSAYNEVLLSDGVRVNRGNPVYGDAKRASLAADTAVRQAHREVSRVERELGLSHYEEPSSFSRKHRSYSYSGPREYSVAPRAAAATTYHSNYHHVPATYHYHRRTQQLPQYEYVESAPAYRPLYPPEKLVRCLTETPVTRISGRSVDDIVLGSGLRSRSVLPYTPQLHISPSVYLPTHATTSGSSSSSSSYKRSYHHAVPAARYYAPLPHYTRSSSVTSSSGLHHLPESVGLWYHKPATHYYGSSYDLSTPLVTSYHHQPVRSHVSLTSSSYPSSAATVSLGPSPPYHTRVLGEGSFESFSSHSDNYPQLHHYHVPLLSSSTTSWTPSPASTYHHSLSRNVHNYLNPATSTVYVSKASSLSPSLDKPLESHVEVSEARKKVRQVLCKVPERIVIA